MLQAYALDNTQMSMRLPRMPSSKQLSMTNAQMSVVETGQMSLLLRQDRCLLLRQDGQMSAAETGHRCLCS